METTCFWPLFLKVIGGLIGLLSLSVAIGLLANYIEEKSNIWLAFLFVLFIVIIVIAIICYIDCLQ